MQPNAQGMCFTYYGSWDKKTKPKLGVIYFMLDEHVKSIVEKEKKKLHEDMNKLTSDFRKSMECTFKKQSKDIATLTESLKTIEKFLETVIELNLLKKPKITQKKKVKSVPKKEIDVEIEDDEEEISEGYL